jgi:hypothetical protein
VFVIFSPLLVFGGRTLSLLSKRDNDLSWLQVYYRVKLVISTGWLVEWTVVLVIYRVFGDISESVVASVFTGFGLAVDAYQAYSLRLAHQKAVNGEFSLPAEDGSRVQLETTVQVQRLDSQTVYKASAVFEVRSLPTKEYDGSEGKLPENEIKVVDYTKNNGDNKE